MYVYVCMCVYIYIYIYIHTHIHGPGFVRLHGHVVTCYRMRCSVRMKPSRWKHGGMFIVAIQGLSLPLAARMIICLTAYRKEGNQNESSLVACRRFPFRGPNFIIFYSVVLHSILQHTTYNITITV